MYLILQENVSWCIQKAGEYHFGNSFMVKQNVIYNFHQGVYDYIWLGSVYNHITVLFASVEVLLRR
jgi:hypothetical protein